MLVTIITAIGYNYWIYYSTNKFKNSITASCKNT